MSATDTAKWESNKPATDTAKWVSTRPAIHTAKWVSIKPVGQACTFQASACQANCANNADLFFTTFWLDFLTNKPAFSDWLLLAVYQACLARLCTIHVYLA